MKKLEAIIRPYKVEDIRQALDESGFHGISITEVKGYGRQLGHTEFYRGSEYSINFLPKVKIEVVCSDANAERAVAIISQSARTGDIGDGKIFISTIEEVVRIRTEETGEGAL